MVDAGLCGGPLPERHRAPLLRPQPYRLHGIADELRYALAGRPGDPEQPSEVLVGEVDLRLRHDGCHITRHNATRQKAGRTSGGEVDAPSSLRRRVASHAGLVVRSKDYQRVQQLVRDYDERFKRGFMISMPAPEKSTA